MSQSIFIHLFIIFSRGSAEWLVIDSIKLNMKIGGKENCEEEKTCLLSLVDSVAKLSLLGY